MRIFIATLSLLAVLFSMTAEMAHAHASSDAPDHSISAHMDNKPDCDDASCGSCALSHHLHAAMTDTPSLGYSKAAHVIAWARQIVANSPIYGVIRPPQA